MKIIAKPLTIAIVLFISSLTLMGQKSLLFNDVQPLIAVASNTKIDVELSTENISAIDWFYMEERIPIENWMISAEQWGIAENETQLDLEGWMLQPYGKADINLSELVKEELESPLKLEEWMYCCTDWKIISL